MALFGGARPRTTMPGVVPYYPTPEEQAMAIPGQASPMPPATRMPRGMFGASMAGGAQPGAGGDLSTIMSQALNQSAAPQPSGQPGSILAGALSQVPSSGQPTRSNLPAVAITGELPQPKIDLSSLAAPVDLSNVQVKKPGFFQHGGLGEKILKGLGEFSLRYSASQGDPYATMVLRNRFEQHQQQLRLLEQVKQRQAERDEWMWREQWKREHPDDQFTQYMQAAGIDPASAQGQALYRQRAESMAAPPLMAVDGYDAQGNQTKTFYPRTAFGGGMGGQSAPAGPAPGTVRNGYRFNGGNPNDRNSWVPVGGASPGGGANFR
ncbi:hypothetical protein [Sphingomonas paucimobilis]|uniref:hypothetical protein n=1 Tax=Sphingomonas paucimobilis TaxID=13689 RepID=UPI0019D2EDCD|nr:hypothetical protein [Sphingomonas paucimobilis]